MPFLQAAELDFFRLGGHLHITLRRVLAACSGNIPFQSAIADAAQVMAQCVRDKRRARCTNGNVKMTPLNGLIGYAVRRAQLAIFADFNQTLASLNLRQVNLLC